VARITLSPAPADSGILFRVRATGERIPARADSVVNSHYATTVGVNGTRIQTVEHLMAALSGFGVDNVEIEVDGPEIPALDGSAKPFVALLSLAGRVQQSARLRPLTIPCALRVGDNGRWMQIVPSDTFRISYTLDNEHPAIGTQVLSWTPTERSFVEDFAPARTYGFLKDLGLMRKNGLAPSGGPRSRSSRPPRTPCATRASSPPLVSPRSKPVVRLISPLYNGPFVVCVACGSSSTSVRRRWCWPLRHP